MFRSISSSRRITFLPSPLEHIENQNVYMVDGPLDLTVLMKLYGLEGFDHLKAPRYTPQPVPQLRVFSPTRP